jgi:hypothetical protein
MDKRLCFGQRLALGFKVQIAILVGGIDAIVAKPMSNAAQIHSGPQQHKRRAVPAMPLVILG